MFLANTNHQEAKENVRDRISLSANLMLIVFATISAFNFTATALTAILLLVWLALSIANVLRFGELRIYPLVGLIFLYLIWLGVTVWWSTIPNASWLAAWVFAALPISYLAWLYSPKPDQLWQVIKVVMQFSGPGLAAWGIGQVMVGYGHGWPVGPLVDKNAYAALMNLFWFFGATYLILAATSNVYSLSFALRVLGLLLVAVALFSSESRGAILTWLLLMPIILWQAIRATSSWRTVALIILIALTGFLISNYFLGLNVASRTIDIQQDASTSARLQLWWAACRMITDNAFWGTGLGTFASHYPAYRELSENTTSGRYVHNDYLQIAVEGGVVLVFLLIVISLALVRNLWISLSQRKNLVFFEASGLLIAVLTLFIHASLNFIFYFTFVNVLTGVLAARAIQIRHAHGIQSIKLNFLPKLTKSVRILLFATVTLLVMGPLALHLIAQTTLTGVRPGLSLLKIVWPALTPYQIADLITALRPTSGIGQEALLNANEEALRNSAGLTIPDGDLQYLLFNELLDRYALRRSQTNDQPVYGLREAKVLIDYRGLLKSGVALKLARVRLDENLRKDPFHVDSMIFLSRLDSLQGAHRLALLRLARSYGNVLSRRDQQLIKIEMLRQRSTPIVIPELDIIERELRGVRSESETGRALIIPVGFSEKVDTQLSAIEKEIPKKTDESSVFLFGQLP